jgi:TonB family protein
MKFRNLVVLCTCVLAATTGRAQNAPTQQDLEVRLKSQFLMLRGMWDGDRLAFDSQGNLFGSAEKTFFSLSAVIVTQIQLGDTQLDIHGRRAGFEFSYSKPLHQPPHTPPYDLAAGLMIGAKPYSNVEIEIARDSAHPEALDDAINKVFSIGIDEQLAASAPYYWQSLLDQHLHPGQKSPEPASTDRIYHPGGGVTNPILRYAPDPAFSTAARKLGVAGVAVIGLVVDENGLPRQVHVVRPLGMGGDECAVAAVLQYRFSPAIYHGHPVPAEINIEVNFRPR